MSLRLLRAPGFHPGPDRLLEQDDFIRTHAKEMCIMSSQPSRIYSYPVADGLFIREEYQESSRHFIHPGVFATDQVLAAIR